MKLVLIRLHRRNTATYESNIANFISFSALNRIICDKSETYLKRSRRERPHRNFGREESVSVSLQREKCRRSCDSPIPLELDSRHRYHATDRLAANFVQACCNLKIITAATFLIDNDIVKILLNCWFWSVYIVYCCVKLLIMFVNIIVACSHSRVCMCHYFNFRRVSVRQRTKFFCHFSYLICFLKKLFFYNYHKIFLHSN